MYAIALSFDEQSGFVELLYKKYMELWPECPFIFRVPVNNENRNKSYEFFDNKKNVDLIKSNKSIKLTMKALLGSLPDDEWVYWAIDDRFPISISNKKYLDNLVKSLSDFSAFSGYDGIKVFRWNEKASCVDKTKDFKEQHKKEMQAIERSTVDVLGYRCFKQVALKWGLFHHHFCRVRFLKDIFINNKLNNDYKIKNIYHAISMYEEKYKQKILVPIDKDSILFGEPCIGGKITPNGLSELKKHSCVVPKYNVLKYGKEFINKDTPSRSDFYENSKKTFVKRRKKRKKRGLDGRKKD